MKTNRIKELAEQARDYTVNATECGWLNGDEIFAEKFAELIQEDLHRRVLASILITDVLMEERGLVPKSDDYIEAINTDLGIEK